MSKYTSVKDGIARKVVDFYAGNAPVWEQIVHTQTVASYTRLIAVGEGMDEEKVDLMEIAAWLHDIGCPSARELYGNSQPVHQQEEGRRVAEAWLEGVDGLSEEDKKWLVEVVAHHHQLPSASELHFEPLFEADLIVNLIEGYYELKKAPHFYDHFLVTPTGKRLFEEVILGVM